MIINIATMCVYYLGCVHQWTAVQMMLLMMMMMDVPNSCVTSWLLQAHTKCSHSHPLMMMVTNDKILFIIIIIVIF